MVDANKAREELQHIMERKEYRVYYEDTQNILEIWWGKAKDWIADQLSKLIPSFTPSSSAAEIVLIAICLVLVVMLGFAVFLITRKTIRNRTLRNKIPLQSIEELNWTYHQHLAEARKQEATGNYTLSSRHMFLALLLFFHEKEWLEARIWKTNWEYYEELRKVNSDWAELFSNLAYLFDEVTYGKRNVRKEEYIQYREQAMFWLKSTVEWGKG